MKFRAFIFYFSLLTSFFTFSQSNYDSINNHIDKQLKKAASLTYDYKYNEALTLIQRSLKQSDSIKNDNLLARSYLVYGILNNYLGKKKLAIQNERKAEIIFKKTKNYKRLGSVYNNIGWIYSDDLKQIDSIIIYYKKALETYTLAKDNRRITTALNNLGYNYMLTGKLDKAEAMLKKALQLYKKTIKTSKKQYLSEIHLSLCELYLKKNEDRKALYHVNLAEKEVLKNNYERNLIEVYELKSKIYEVQKNHIKSLYYLKKYHEKLLKAHKNEKSNVIHEEVAKHEVKEHKEYLKKATLEYDIKEDKLKKSTYFMILIVGLFFITLLSTFLLYKNNRLKIDNNKLLKVKHQKLKDLQLKTELTFLKTQIQPHFFFNTLNNLYALIIERSCKAKEVVIKLSELMRYTLNGSKTITVPIEEEINNINNYLELESLRYEKITFSSIKIIGNIDNVKVPPLLFITFIENCFKHNNVDDKDFNLSISFKSLDSKNLFFNVQNTFITQNKEKKTRKKGIGIENIKRRLKLIYRDKYNLDITTKNNLFTVNLKIPIQNQYYLS